ncbi:hypothetical protein E2C01_068385 [Portunus trituberculatus]|uniref:Uncharacterized protein n=1 Tax=Portunus trituberculatus TaxID=210409 RepID=A0A5B7HNP7_PORTR|nr:hypothetical protein [Portunus trituberculatus]
MERRKEMEVVDGEGNRTSPTNHNTFKLSQNSQLINPNPNQIQLGILYCVSATSPNLLAFPRASVYVSE